MDILTGLLRALAPENISQYFLFFIPGFISMQVGALLVPVSDNDFGKRVPIAVGFSALNYALMTVVIECAKLLNLAGISGIIAFAFTFVLPFAYPFAFKYIREHQWLGITTPFPTAWDEFFSRRKQYWVRVHLKTGDILTAWYGYPGSAASQYPEAQQLYLSELWENVAGTMQKIHRTGGMLISMTEVEYLEFLT